jgi:hypothetical protein
MMAKRLLIPIIIILGAWWLVACGSSKSTSLPTRVRPGPNSVPVTDSNVISSTAAMTQSPLVRQGADTSTADHANRTVFLIVLENTNWSQIEGSEHAPYINKVLLPRAAYARQYYNPPNLHPSEPNYLWLEAGANFGITNDENPSINHQSTTQHLVTLLDQKGISWKSYQEDISGTDCPLTSNGLYAPKHNPMVFFDDVTDTNNPNSTHCINHVRPFSELAADLQNNTVARYNFIIPNLCNDMHNHTGCVHSDPIQNGDEWLANNVPAILNSQAYAEGGVLFITWDEGSGNDAGGGIASILDKAFRFITRDEGSGNDGPIGLIVLSPNARGGGYSNSIHYTHSSLLRTIQEIFGITPFLGDAAQATDVSDLFAAFP